MSKSFTVNCAPDTPDCTLPSAEALRDISNVSAIQKRYKITALLRSAASAGEYEWTVVERLPKALREYLKAKGYTVTERETSTSISWDLTK